MRDEYATHSTFFLFYQQQKSLPIEVIIPHGDISKLKFVLRGGWFDNELKVFKNTSFQYFQTSLILILMKRLVTGNPRPTKNFLIVFRVSTFQTPTAYFERLTLTLTSWGLKVDMRAFRQRVFIPKCHRNNSELKQNIWIFHPKKNFLKKIWLENSLFLCISPTKRHRHELSESWKNFLGVKITFWYSRYIRLSAENTLGCQDVKFGPILMEIETQT